MLQACLHRVYLNHVTRHASCSNCLSHLWIIFESCLNHVKLMSISCLNHAEIMSKSFLSNFVFTSCLNHYQNDAKLNSKTWLKSCRNHVRNVVKSS